MQLIHVEGFSSLVLVCSYVLLNQVYSKFQCKREGYVQRFKDEKGEGCTIHGFVNVNKVAGNFHFAPGKGLDQSFNFLQDLLNLQPETYNASRAKFNSLYPYRSIQYRS